MPKSKTIEIDEIITPEKPAGDESRRQQDGAGSTAGGSSRGAADQAGAGGHNPFGDFHKALPWKARITLRLTQWLVLIKSKSWGKFIIVPIIILGVLLLIPVGLIFIFLIIIRSIFSPRRH